jgi:hypothetical protein
MCHCAPVLSIQSVPSRTWRVETGLRPGRPSAENSPNVFCVETRVTNAIPHDGEAEGSSGCYAGDIVFRHACDLGFEEIVSKRLGLALQLRPLA